MGTTTSSPNHEPLGRTGRTSFHHGRSSFRSPTKDRGGVGGPRRMDRLRRSLRDSFRKRKEHVPESSKPHMWQADEAAVRAGTCNFNVKYLGCVEVFESRGMQVCEEALKVLRNSRRRPVKAILYVSGDGLRVVEDETKGLIVDQTIEKVSFCAPDRNHEKGFSYICRDGTTRRWMCHGFLALKESGERLSHAVGCAFAACLERKQKRDKECGVTMTFDNKTSTFTRTGSFRQASITDRLQDPQECKPTGTDWDSVIESWKQDGVQITETPKETETVKEPPPVKPVHNPFAIERPHATPSMLERQGSFRGFNALNQASPFKRQLSLRISDLPSTLERQRSQSLEGSDLRAPPRPTVAATGVCLPANTSPQPPPRTQRNRLHSLPNAINISPIPEASPISDKTDPVSAMCQQLSQGLSLLSSVDDPFPPHPPERPGQQMLSTHAPLQTNLFAAPAAEPAAPLHIIDPIKFHNPWMNDPKPKKTTASQVNNTTTTCTMSWGNMSVASTAPVNPASTSVSWGTMAVASTNAANEQTTELTLGTLETSTTNSDVIIPDTLPRPEQWLGSLTASPVGSNGIAPTPPRRAPHLSHLRAHSLGSAENYMGPKQGWNRNDPFDAEWANMAGRTQASTNPFAQGAVKAFEVQM